MTAEQEADLIGPEAVAGKAHLVHRGLAFLDALLRRARAQPQRARDARRAKDAATKRGAP